jgi:hypothetical protein
LKNGKNNFNLYYKSEYFDRFEYDEEKKRFQSYSGYLSIEKVYQLDKRLEKDRKIEWI